MGPSVFPILFACVLGRTSHAILLWRLEKGEYAGILDLLAGSTSFTSTITSQLKLRLFSILGLVLVATWALSPVGGQACLRPMSIGRKGTDHNASFVYMQHSPNLYTLGGMDSSSVRAITAALFASAVIAPPTVKSSPLDVWGHIKIPAVEHYERISSPDVDGWFDTNSSQPQYSSLSGIPIAGINETAFIDYKTKIEASYFSLECIFHSSSPGNSSGPNNTAFTYEGDALMWTYDDADQRNHTDVHKLEPLSFSYWARKRVSHWSHCQLTTAYVEAEVHCATTSSCGVQT